MADRFVHPTSEGDLVALVKEARDKGGQLRVTGSGHSVAGAIAPDGNNTFVMLDKYRGVDIAPDPSDPTHAVVSVKAGTNLGRNPYDPTGTSTWENSLNATLQRSGYALDDLGGISHQTVSGFLATGSSGGSTTHAIDENVIGLRFVDGEGNVHDVGADAMDAFDRDLFHAAGVSMGLLGVTSEVRFRVRPTYNLFGTQVTTSTGADCPIDLFGPGGGPSARPSLRDYLDRAPYSRLMWWPQQGFERVQIWQAGRLEPLPGFQPQPYEEIGRSPILEALAGSLFYTLMGNLDDLTVVPQKLGAWYKHLQGAVAGQPNVNVCAYPRPRQDGPTRAIAFRDVLAFLEARFRQALLVHHASPVLHSAALANGAPADDELLRAAGFVQTNAQGGLPDWLAWAITKLVELLLHGVLDNELAKLLGRYLKAKMPWLVKDILDPFIPLGTQSFWDTWMCGLPMDNQMDDELFPTWFTELWIPIEKTEAVMKALGTFYAGGGDPATAYARTGAFSCELYAAKKNELWLSPSYGTDVFRVDVFWFGLNAGSVTAFYQQFWELLAPFGFRAHWGKFLPGPNEAWRQYWRKQYPMLDRWLALRSKLDPKNVFLTRYWQEHLVGAAGG